MRMNALFFAKEKKGSVVKKCEELDNPVIVIRNITIGNNVDFKSELKKINNK